MTITRTQRLWIAFAATAICAGIVVGLLNAPQRGIPHWIQLLKRKDSLLDLALQSLWSKLPEDARTFFVFLRPTPASEAQRAAWDALPAIGASDKNSVDILIRALDDPAPEIRLWSIQAIARIGPSAPQSTGPLLKLLRDPFSCQSDTHGIGLIRGHVAQTLGRVAPPSDAIFSTLLDLLRDTGQDVAPKALEALIDLALRSDDPLRHLLDTLAAIPAHASFEILPQRDRLIGALGEIRPVTPQALNALSSLFESPDRQSQVSAIATVGCLGPLAKATIPELTSLLSRPANPETEWVRRQAIFALGNMGKEAFAVIPLLTKECQNSNNLVRFDAALARWHIDGKEKETISVLAAGLSDPRIQNRRAALDVASAISSSSPEAIQLITTALHDSQMQIRMGGIEILSKLGNKASPAIPDLRELTKDPKYAIQIAARNLLKKLAQEKTAVKD